VPVKLVRLLSLFVLSLFVVAPAVAQKRFMPEKMERATKVDDYATTQWVEWAELKCPNCSGTGKVKCQVCERFTEDATNCPDCKRKEGHETVCHVCAGKGTIPDPLEKAPCPGCLGASYLLCMVCAGGGQLKVDKAKRSSDCPACRGAGAFKCGVCNGERFVDTATLKPSLAQANAAALLKAMAATDQALKDIEAFSPAGGDKARKEVKAFIKILESVQGFYAPLKKLPKVFEDYLSKTYAGAGFQGHEEHEARAMGTVKQCTEYYLKLNRRMMELALKRAEANGDTGKK